MNCDDAHEAIVHRTTGNPRDGAAELETHLVGCAACRELARQYEGLWRALDGWNPDREALDSARGTPRVGGAAAAPEALPHARTVAAPRRWRDFATAAAVAAALVLACASVDRRRWGDPSHRGGGEDHSPGSLARAFEHRLERARQLDRADWRAEARRRSSELARGFLDSSSRPRGGPRKEG